MTERNKCATKWILIATKGNDPLECFNPDFGATFTVTYAVAAREFLSFHIRCRELSQLCNLCTTVCVCVCVINACEMVSLCQVSAASAFLHGSLRQQNEDKGLQKAQQAPQTLTASLLITEEYSERTRMDCRSDIRPFMFSTIKA